MKTEEPSHSSRLMPVADEPSSVTGMEGREPDDLAARSHEPVHDCWNQIGVGGNGTCRELIKYVHCRNCPVYGAAGLQLLNRPLPADYRRERTEHYAHEKKIAKPARLSVVLFRLGSEWLALPTSVFQEVAERRAMHTLPHRRRGLALGLVNVRGELLPCASVARLLSLSETKPAAMTRSHDSHPTGQGAGPDRSHRPPHGTFERLLVAGWQGQRVAFPVDEVQGIQRIPQDELHDPPATLAKSTITYTRGVFRWRERTVGLLDAEAFFTAINRSLA